MSAPLKWDNGLTTWDEPDAYWDYQNTRPAPPALAPVAGTTYIPFVPSSSANFQFQVTLDGTVYTGIVTWSLFGQRYYLNLYTSAGALVVALPLIGSPVDYNISLTAGYFTTQLVYRVQSNSFEVFG